MNQANRLIRNVLVTYLRMAVTVGIGLTTTRLLLGALGSEDYGLYFVLGGGLSLIMVISAALSDSAQRHLAFEIGRGDDRALREVFSTSVVIYLALGLVVAGVGLALRPAFLHGLTIPEDRQAAASWVYDLALLTLSLSVLATPFLAVFMARQALVQDAVFAVVSSVLGLVAVLLIPYVHADALIAYALLAAGVRLLLMGLQIGRGLWLFPESRFRPGLFRRRRVRELIGFAGWSFLGQTAWQMRNHGGNILLNLFFGPSVNTAYSLSIQVSTYLTSYANGIIKAVRPAMTSMEGAGKRDLLVQLTHATNKLTPSFLCLVAVPVMVNLDTVLAIWLPEVPQYTKIFIGVSIAWILTFNISAGFGLAVTAIGRIGQIIRVTSVIALAPLPLCFLIYSYSQAGPPTYIYLVWTSIVAVVIFRVIYVGKMIGVSTRLWLWALIKSTILPLLPAIIAALAVKYLIDDAMTRFIATSVVYLILAIPCMWLYTFSGDQRKKIINFVNRT